jgi:hypothetical protein
LRGREPKQHTARLDLLYCKARQSIRRPTATWFCPSWARPAPRGWSEAVEPPCPEVTTRGFATKYSHRLYRLFLQSLRIPLFGVALRAPNPRLATCHRADRTPRVLFNSTPSAGTPVSALHRAKPRAAEVERLAPHGLFGLTFHVCQQAASRQRTQYIQGKLW